MTHPISGNASTIPPSFTSRVVPVVVIHNAQHAVPMCQALLEGGIDVVEITLRTPAALAAIEAVARIVPGMYVGAGTLTRASEVPSLVNAGARFALSPGCTPTLVEAVQAAGLPFIPGVATASEAMAARDWGYTLMKCFPAAPLGGIEIIKAWAGPLPDIRFCPTGGVSVQNMRQFLALPQVAMVGGSWLTPAALLESGNWARVTQLAKEATQLSIPAP
jgi:2-dehydro-3-deoxyphosphogluconate aldolase/(4S)-4-hydroxy-2-oxoglutarate aldolase